MKNYLNSTELPDDKFDISSFEVHFCSQCPTELEHNHQSACPTQALVPSAPQVLVIELSEPAEIEKS
jgi:hypothetical protein